MKDKKDIRLNLRMSGSQFTALKAVAAAREKSISEMVRIGIEWAIQRFGNGQENREVEQGKSETQEGV